MFLDGESGWDWDWDTVGVVLADWEKIEVEGKVVLLRSRKGFDSLSSLLMDDVPFVPRVGWENRGWESLNLAFFAGEPSDVSGLELGGMVKEELGGRGELRGVESWERLSSDRLRGLEGGVDVWT